MSIYYNEHDPFAVKWLKELIIQGHLPDGDVDSRSIKDVRATDLVGYSQCHFFAGIGGWPLALKQAGWGDRPVWTGSCPCQPFSDAGKQKGFDDDRHLWPVFYDLIRQCQPNTVFGEQVASKIALAWLDDVQADLEREDYAFSAVDLCAAGYGAPHIRQRLFWVANANGGNPSPERQQHGGGHLQRTQDTIDGKWVANTKHDGLPTSAQPRHLLGVEQYSQWTGQSKGENNLLQSQTASGDESLSAGLPCPTNGFWRDADWLRCRDGKWRPVEPGTFPLVDGVSARMGRLRGYGNAIVVPLAVEFIQACIAI